jgi:23S rRNA-intervening sequence protein
MSDLAVVVQKAYDWNLWVLPKVEKFPRAYRFSVGDHLVAASLDLLMNLVDASYQSRNAAPLAAAVRNVNRVRYLVRLSKGLRLINLKAYEFAAEGLDEIGRMTGGWWKSERKKLEEDR